jgi:hypothetical protein
MTSSTSAVSASDRWRYWPVGLLVLQNLGVFWNHYFRGFGFPWDFPAAYFGMSAFSVKALEHGLLPQWMPYQCMGYPYALNLQSGLYYPPLWVFPLLHLPYDLRAATIFQCLHVLFGALGMFALLRQLFRSRAYAIVGASMFQFFGGFYGNSQHPDIVRSFALVPWLFLAFTIDHNSPTTRTARLLLLPLLVYLLATGGYPGNLLSTSFVLGVYLAMQLVATLRAGGTPRRAAVLGAALGGLFVLGLALAAVHLGPAWAEREHLARYGAEQRYMSLWLDHLPALFYSSTPAPGERSMTSTFLTVPGLLLAFFVSWRGLKERWIWAVVLAASVLMVAGERSLFWRVMVTVAEPLGFSRFPSSDYRPLIAVALVVLAGLGLRCLHRGELGPWSFALRSVIALSAVIVGGRALYGSWLARPVVLGATMALLTLALLAGLRARRHAAWAWRAATAGLVALIFLDAFRVLPDLTTWREPEIGTLYERRGWKTSPSMFDDFPRTRPAREDTGHPAWFSWAGYLQAGYMMSDKAPCLLLSASKVSRNPVYEEFMSREWTPLILPAPRTRSEAVPVAVGARVFDNALARSGRKPPALRQTRYEIDEITYRVTLAREALVVENEMYFPGWEAILDLPGGRRRIPAVGVNGVFRSWVLPQGNYSMVARFRPRHLAVYRGTSLASLILWLLLLCRPFLARRIVPASR